MSGPQSAEAPATGAVMAMGGLGVGDVFAGKYRIERVLGHGGMGVVVGAHHLQLDELVAIKVLHPTFATQPEQVERFLREGRAAVKIRSEHVARVSDIGTIDGGVPYMVMEFLEGLDLAELVKRRGAQSVDDVVTWVLQACEALAEAHALGIVHRDLKPANLFLTERPDGSPCLKVLDFGISKLLDGGLANAALTNTNGMMGSPYYMSPEQLSSPRGVDVRADVWALGVILFELLSGLRPYHAESLTALVLAIATEPPRSLGEVAPELPKELEAVVERCLAKKAEDRFPDVGAFAQALLPFAPKGAEASVERIQRVLATPRRSKTGATDRLPAIREPIPREPSAATDPRATDARSKASSASQSGPRRTVNPEQKQLHAASLDDQQGATLLESSPPPAVDGATTGKSLATTNEGVSASRPPAPPAPARGRALPWIAGAAVLGAAVVLVAQLRGPAAQTSVRTGAAAASSAASSAAASGPSHAPAPATPSIAPSIAPSAAPTAVVGAASTSAATPASTSTAGAPLAAPKLAPAGKPKPSCDPPYTLDADGQKHFKVECL